MPHPDTSCQRSALHKGFSSRDNLKFAPCGTVKQSPAEYYSALGFRRVIISPVCILMVVSWCLTQSSLVHWQCLIPSSAPQCNFPKSKLSSPLLLGLNFLSFPLIPAWVWSTGILHARSRLSCSFILLVLTEDPCESVFCCLSALPGSTGRVASSLPGMSAWHFSLQREKKKKKSIFSKYCKVK